MISLKGPGEVEAEILMTRQAFSGAFLVLEGPDDSRFWRPRTASTCEVVIAGGKPAAIGGIRRLDARAFRGAVAVVDDDCDRLRGVAPVSSNVVHTDLRDLEGILLRSGALDRVLAEFGDPAKLSGFQAASGSVQDALLDRGLPLGRLRWYSCASGIGINFKKLVPQRFVDETLWTFDEDALLDAVVAQPHVPDRPDLVAALQSLTTADPWQVCHGHDLIDLLGLGLAHVIGNKNPGRDRIGSVLRSGLDGDEMRGLMLHQELRQWENINRPFCVVA